MFTEFYYLYAEYRKSIHQNQRLLYTAAIIYRRMLCFQVILRSSRIAIFHLCVGCTGSLKVNALFALTLSK